MPPADQTMQTAPVQNNLLLFLGTGVVVSSIFLGIAIGLIYVFRRDVREFRYGVFYSVFALVASIGFLLGSIAFFFQYLTINIAAPCSLISLLLMGALSLLASFVRKDSRVLFGVLSIYCLVTVYLVPVFIWNMIYLLVVARRRQMEHEQPLDATQ